MARGKPRPIGGCGCLLLLLVLGAAALGGFVAWSWAGPGPATHPVTVTIAEGATLRSSARVLEKAGVIRSAPLFHRLARILGSQKTIRAGEYEVPARASASAVLALLQAGRTKQRFVTIPEGMPSILVQQKLMAEPLLTGPIAVPAEGSVLPDSYSFVRGETRAAVLKRMQAAMTETLARLWKARKPTTVVKTPREAIILASIVEKETALPAERRQVAAVYTNRLRAGMLLQADPTVIYPVTKGKPLGRRILRSELRADNGYNTYVRPGLPEGPIANPGRESIAAVLDPADSPALYFVADGKGGHVFANTLEQHNANVQRYYALRRERGEM
jgi:UPF0755 protein